jgi:hypothetical protein
MMLIASQTQVLGWIEQGEGLRTSHTDAVQVVRVVFRLVVQRSAQCMSLCMGVGWRPTLALSHTLSTIRTVLSLLFAFFAKVLSRDLKSKCVFRFGSHFAALEGMQYRIYDCWRVVSIHV